MRLLVLGGTRFVGRAVAADALAHGVEVTLFGRGRTGPELFPGVPRRIGDRETGDYAALRDGEWDAVVDASGYVPRQVGQAMAALGDRVGRYLFISSHAVYVRTGVGPGSDEDTPRRPPVRDTQELVEETYGPLKGGVRGRRDGTVRRPGDDRAGGQGGRPARPAGRLPLLGTPGGAGRPGGVAR
jgi:2'-hydroxyisoflavone reductase